MFQPYIGFWWPNSGSSPSTRGWHKETAPREGPSLVLTRVGSMQGNTKNPAIRRIHADIRELKSNPSSQYYAEPLEENLFEWHFTLRGPPGTDFDGGIYHGRILLPPEYPFKPPNIMLLTPNGRFEVGKKICLSISAHHPEHWQPAWGIRLILEALISFFPTDPKGAVGSLDWTPAERNRLARESVSWCCPRCGPLTSILKSPSAGEGGAATTEESGSGANPSPYAKEISQLYVRGATADGAAAEAQSDGAEAANGQDQQQAEERAPTTAELGGAAPTSSATRSSTPARGPAAPLAPAAVAATGGTGAAAARRAAPARPTAARRAPEEAEEDKLLYVAIALFVVIVALLIRKVNKIMLE